MIEMLYSMLGGAPVIGQPIALAYLNKRVKKTVATTKDRILDFETAGMMGAQLDSYLQDTANGIYNKQLHPYVSTTYLSEDLIEPLREKAIEELFHALKEKVQLRLITMA